MLSSNEAGLVLSRCDLGRSSRFQHKTCWTLNFKMWAVNLLQLVTRYQPYITSVTVQLQANDSAALTLSSGEAVLDYNMKHVFEIKAEVVNYSHSILLSAVFILVFY